MYCLQSVASVASPDHVLSRSDCRRKEEQQSSSVCSRQSPSVLLREWVCIKFILPSLHITPRLVGAFGFGFTVMPTLSVSVVSPSIFIASLLTSDSTSF